LRQRFVYLETSLEQQEKSITKPERDRSTQWSRAITKGGNWSWDRQTSLEANRNYQGPARVDMTANWEKSYGLEPS
jgi:hypothetical protein